MSDILDRFIAKTLTVSSAHVPESVANALNADQLSGRPFAYYDGGQEGTEPLRVDFDDVVWRLRVDPHQIQAARDYGWTEIKLLLKLAWNHDCDYLVLDGDGEVLPEEMGFKTFEWEA